MKPGDRQNGSSCYKPGDGLFFEWNYVNTVMPDGSLRREYYVVSAIYRPIMPWEKEQFQIEKTKVVKVTDE